MLVVVRFWCATPSVSKLTAPSMKEPDIALSVLLWIFCLFLSRYFLRRINHLIRLFFLLAAGALLCQQWQSNQNTGREERGGLKQPLFLPTPTITPHFSDVFILLHRHTPAVCTLFFTISVYSDLCSLFQPVCLRPSFFNKCYPGTVAAVIDRLISRTVFRQSNVCAT